MAFAVASPARLAARTTTAAAPRRGSAVVVRASASEPVDRRAVLGAGLAALATTFAAAANAIEIPSQASTGSTVRRGSIPPSSSGASMSGYVMEGTKKRGLSPAQKKKKLAKAKEAILANDR